MSPQARANRLLLANAMRARGFIPYSKEWWHFTLRNEPFPDSYFDFPVQLNIRDTRRLRDVSLSSTVGHIKNAKHSDKLRMSSFDRSTDLVAAYRTKNRPQPFDRPPAGTGL